MSPVVALVRAQCTVGALLSGCSLALLAWARRPVLPDEGRYVGCTVDAAAATGLPTLDGLPYFPQTAVVLLDHGE